MFRKSFMILAVLCLAVVPLFASGTMAQANTGDVPELSGQVEIELEGKGDTFTGHFYGHENQGELVLKSRGKTIKNNLEIQINGEEVIIRPEQLRKSDVVEINVGTHVNQGLNEIKVEQKNNAQSPAVVIPYLTLKDGKADEVGLSSERLEDIDQVVEQAMDNGVIPGAVVLVAKDGVVVKESSYGFAQKYDMGNLLDRPVAMETNTIFDLASVTKVMATTQGIMKLVSEGKLRVTDKVSDIIPEFANNGKESVTIEDLLTHTSGLTPWTPTYYFTDNSKGVLEYINDLPLEYETGTSRKYSDFSFMMLGFVIEEVTGMKLNDYLDEQIYETLNMGDTQFVPSAHLKNRMAATSWGNPYEHKMVHDPNFGYNVDVNLDAFDGWRDYTLIGEVNDGNSYYANGGIAGHAGLFSTARDLSVLGQTMLNGGGYGLDRIYDSTVVKEFTSPQRYTHGYGWELNTTWYMGNKKSPSAFGHTGFTGTQIIFDPEHQLQIIILTNKQNMGTTPSGSYRSTGPLSKEISDIVYDSIEK
ncbi:serine hydrolase [Bacillus sp. FJAT-27251]|uniref:serine hydrolase n=1 Tax=Bacillus sp. FJAT-27251 TaxID=1684142 RepID=UPI000AD2F1AB|nr:serine hydrolase [Bacillus sp. FJAT-27251]